MPIREENRVGIVKLYSGLDFKVLIKLYGSSAPFFSKEILMKI